METRNIAITLDKGREWYKAGGDLKEIALQVFTKDELTATPFEEITTFKKACEVIDISYADFGKMLKGFYGVNIFNKTLASVAAIKLNIIRQALNKGQKMSFTEGTIWYPYTPSITKESTYYNDELRDGDMVEVAQFTHNGETYRLLGGSTLNDHIGLGRLYSSTGVADSDSNVGFLGCATKEIAEHMSKYFAKEIFEAKYSNFIDFEWI